MQFADRRAAGQALAAELDPLPGALVLALPRGGVPVGYELAIALGAELDVLVVRKLGVPGHEELAMGAIAGGGAIVRNATVIASLDIGADVVAAVAERELREVARRERLYRGDRPAPAVRGRNVILVDDGLATGATMRAAERAVRAMSPARVIVAVPVASADTAATFADVVVVTTPADFQAVGQVYRDFSQTTDAEVRELLSPLVP